jgi:hypothetical protein
VLPSGEPIILTFIKRETDFTQTALMLGKLSQQYLGISTQLYFSDITYIKKIT